MTLIIGSLIIALSAFAIATELASEVEASVRSASALRSVVEHTKNMIDCYSLPSDEILKRLERSVLLGCGYEKCEAPKSFMALLEGASIKDSESREIFFAFAKDFGKSFRADELSRCSLYLERMRAR
ncbi:MAG: hypothetical protein J6U68_02815, partial [Clostridia bacterium]|nr:hypothetical protein [Clostridia bacterium]